MSSFCRELQWWSLFNLLSQYSDRINFVVQDELQDLIDQLQGVIDAPKARAIYEAGFSSVYMISKAKPVAIMKALQKTLVVKRQFSEDLKEIFLKSGAEKNFSTLKQAEIIVLAAKIVQKRRRRVKLSMRKA